MKKFAPLGAFLIFMAATIKMIAGFPFDVEISSGIENAYEDAKKKAPPQSENEVWERLGIDPQPPQNDYGSDKSSEHERDNDGREY